jgi:branched-chain amino acid transport system permease protein
MKARLLAAALLAILVAVLASVPWLVADYGLALMISLMSYTVLAIAWALFSGTTRLVSLSTSAFYGIGMYAVAMLVKVMPLYAIFGVAAVVGAAVALVVGLLTLRISGMFFVIFGFGLSEMMRELMIWWEINQTHTMGRYVRVDFDTTMIYEFLLALAVLVFATGWWLRRSKLGIALLVIGEDETVARQAGINVAAAKVAAFVLSSVFMTLVGAVMAPRFGFINPNFAFSPLLSFQVVIMAFLGGLQRLWGPLLGIIPLVLLSEWLQVEFPFWFSVMLGLVFMGIVYFVPRGATGLIEDGWEALRRPMNVNLSLPRGIAGPVEDWWARTFPKPPTKGR